MHNITTQDVDIQIDKDDIVDSMIWSSIDYMLRLKEEETVEKIREADLLLSGLYRKSVQKYELRCSASERCRYRGRSGEICVSQGPTTDKILATIDLHSVYVVDLLHIFATQPTNINFQDKQHYFYDIYKPYTMSISIQRLLLECINKENIFSHLKKNNNINCEIGIWKNNIELIFHPASMLICERTIYPSDIVYIGYIKHIHIINILIESLNELSDQLLDIKKKDRSILRILPLSSMTDIDLVMTTIHKTHWINIHSIWYGLIYINPASNYRINELIDESLRVSRILRRVSVFEDNYIERIDCLNALLSNSTIREKLELIGCKKTNR